MRIWFINKHICVLVLTLFFTLVGFACFGKMQAVSVAKLERDLPIYCVDTGEEKKVSISFDAAWSASKGVPKNKKK